MGDPYLAFWFRFVEPNRSRLGAGVVQAVAREIRSDFSGHVAGAGEKLKGDFLVTAAEVVPVLV